LLLGEDAKRTKKSLDGLYIQSFFRGKYANLNFDSGSFNHILLIFLSIKCSILQCWNQVPSCRSETKISWISTYLV